MKRRGFIRIMAAGSCMALHPAFFSGCTSSAINEELKQLDGNATDIRLQLIAYAILAPSSHNLQPWLVTLTGKNRFNLYVDRNRLLPEVDPFDRQTHITQGTFLEFLKIAASAFGYRVAIDYFPEGVYSNTKTGDKPVAAVHLVADAAVRQDPLFPWLQVRQSNKRVYDEKKIAATDLNKLRRITRQTGLTTEYSDSPQLIRALSPLLGKAMAVETADEDRHRETVDVFRFSEAEATRTRDGFSLANNGVSGFKRFVAETFFLGTREDAYAVDSSFAREGVKMTYKQAESAAAYGWIVSKENNRLDQVKSGELYARINLETARLGISQHPLSQILEEYEDMKPLQRTFLSLLNISPGETVQMLYRLGYAEPVSHTKRRLVRDIVA